MNFFLKKIMVAVGTVCLFAASAFGEFTEIKLDGNAYETSVPASNGVQITGNGVEKWNDQAAVVSVFFSFEIPQKNIGIFLKARGAGTYEVSVGGVKKKVSVPATKGEGFALVPVAEKVDFEEAGYQRVDIRKLADENSDSKDAAISAVVLEGVSGKMNFVHDFSPYWGRRGASVHMGYRLPASTDVEYFYNEVTVPKGYDAIGSYFMACGFGEGYFGIQVNSAQERRVLFSIWSPFDAQNPKDIPENLRVSLLESGEGVSVGEFGNEGAGGQSFLRYAWKAGTTYKFLLRARPNDALNATDYTAWFFSPDENEWRLIASFRRPETRTWVRGAHSFLENFLPRTGWIERRVSFGNQWARDKNGVWHELTEARFSCDDTGARGVRIDFAGKVSSDKKRFSLRNCGFFNGMTPDGSVFSREASNTPPEIPFLEK